MRVAIRLLVVTAMVLAGLTSAMTTANAATSVVCQGYGGCAQSGHSDGGYSAHSSTSVWGMYPGHNCTNYAAYRLQQNGVDASYLRGHGNAYEWGGQASAHGVRVDGTPAVGSIAWWSAGSGHVAYVEEVRGDGSFVSSEDNYGGDFYWKVRDRGSYPNGFIHFGDRPTNHAPIGSFDEATAVAPGTVRVRGWSFDPDSPATPVRVHMYVGGPAGSGAPGVDLGPTSAARPDVRSAYPQAGPNSGFDTQITARGGRVTFYMYAIDGQGGTNPLIATRTVNVPDPNPLGAYDGIASSSGGLLTVAGWNYDPNAPATRTHTHVYVGGPAGSGAPGYDIGPSWLPRPDVRRVYPAAGPATGFSATVPAPAGAVTAYVYAINIGAGDNVLLGQRTVNVKAGPRTYPGPRAGVSNLPKSTTSRVLFPHWSGLAGRPSAVAFDVAYRSRPNTRGAAFGGWVHPRAWTFTTTRSGSMRVSGKRVYQFVVRVRHTTVGAATSAWSSLVTTVVR